MRNRGETEKMRYYQQSCLARSFHIKFGSRHWIERGRKKKEEITRENERERERERERMRERERERGRERGRERHSWPCE